jgi:hypothetical protein
MLELLVPVGVLYLLHRANVINLDYPIRQAVRWRRGAVQLPAEPKEGLFGPEAAPEVARLMAGYPMGRWPELSERTDFAASLFYLQMLERALDEAGVALPDPVAALDAGPSDWFYVQALHALLAHHGTERPRQVALDGVELDAYRLYEGFRSRYDLAEAYMAGLEGVRYLAQDVRRYHRPVDVAFMLYPFLFRPDHSRWGLPRRTLQPAALLAHVAGLVKPGGAIVIANQGEAERVEQHRLLAEAGLPVAWWARHDSPLFAYEPERYVTVVIKP